MAEPDWGKLAGSIATLDREVAGLRADTRLALDAMADLGKLRTDFEAFAESRRAKDEREMKAAAAGWWRIAAFAVGLTVPALSAVGAVAVVLYVVPNLSAAVETLRQQREADKGEMRELIQGTREDVAAIKAGISDIRDRTGRLETRLDSATFRPGRP